MNEVKEKVGNYRYRILALVFMATTINNLTVVLFL